GQLKLTVCLGKRCYNLAREVSPWPRSCFPLFPLEVVLLPEAPLPLHVFARKFLQNVPNFHRLRSKRASNYDSAPASGNPAGVRLYFARLFALAGSKS